MVYDAAAILANLLAGSPDGHSYRVAGIYLEFESNNGGGAVSSPVYDRSGGQAYYDGLSGDRDFLRVPLIAATLDNSDGELYVANNRVTFFAQSSASEGEHGVPFSEAADSRVYGAALVVFPNASDQSQDLVFSRIYFDAGDQRLKLGNAQIGCSWELTFG